MSDISANLSLPYILPSQAQKHVTHNDSIRQLDALVQMAVQSATDAMPPASPADGVRYIVPVGAAGGWTGQDRNLAVFEENAWVFYEPKTGWSVWVVAPGEQRIFDGNDWSLAVDMMDFQNLDYLGVATTADATNRLAVSSEATLLTHAGAGHQVKINKAGFADTASLLFQTGWSARAELGTAGDDDFSVKVSADGATFQQAIAIDRNTAAVRFPNGIEPDRRDIGGLTKGGGSDWWGAVDPYTLSQTSGSSITLAQDRMYFAAFYVDRPVQLLGAFTSLSTASTTPGSVLRSGIYRLGAPNANAWDIGDRVADFGTLPADVAGHKQFNLGVPQIVAKGWYLTAVGVNGAGSKAKYGRWQTPGLTRYYPHGTGTSATPRAIAPQLYLYESSSAVEIAGGLPAVWTGNPAVPTSSTNNWIYQMVFPKWREM